VMVIYYVTSFISLLFNYWSHLFCLCVMQVTTYVTFTTSNHNHHSWRGKSSALYRVPPLRTVVAIVLRGDILNTETSAAARCPKSIGCKIGVGLSVEGIISLKYGIFLLNGHVYTWGHV
jgi:hypothetical protein